MSRAIQFTVFILIFLTIYCLLHYYTLARIASLFGIKRGRAFYSVLILLMLSYVVASFLERMMPGAVSRFFYLSASMWMGFLFLLFFTLIIYELACLVYRFDNRLAGIVIILFVTLLCAYSVINAMSVRVKIVEASGFDREMTLVHLSDIHVGTVRGSRFMDKLVRMTNELDPDIVFITGDFVDGSGPLDVNLFFALNEIRAKKFFVLGNHEKYEGEEKVISMFELTDVEVLKDRSAEYMGVQVHGVDFVEGKAAAKEKIMRIENDKGRPSVLLSHVPVGLDIVASKNITLMLAGHTHRGQIFPFSLFVRLAFKNIYGEYRKGNTLLYVTSGAGTWGPPMRLGSENELVLIRTT